MSIWRRSFLRVRIYDHHTVRSDKCLGMPAILLATVMHNVAGEAIVDLSPLATASSGRLKEFASFAETGALETLGAHGEWRVRLGPLRYEGRAGDAQRVLQVSLRPADVTSQLRANTQADAKQFIADYALDTFSLPSWLRLPKKG